MFVWKKRMTILLLLMIILQLFSPGINLASTEGIGQQKEDKHLVLLLIPGFGFDELDAFLTAIPPAIQQDLQYGAMTMRTDGGMTLLNNVLTLATGYPSSAPHQWNSYPQNEVIEMNQAQKWTAGELYQQRVGSLPTKEIVHPTFYQLIKNWNEQVSSELSPGWLGELLEAEQIYTSAYGNGDVLNQKQRIAPTLIMDQSGQANGIIDSSILTADPQFPTGYKTNLNKLSTEIEKQWSLQKQSFSVVEIGDLVRIEAEEEYLAPEQKANVREEVIKQTAHFVHQMASLSQKQQGKEIEIWVLSPIVSREAFQAKKHLLPMVTWNEGQGNGFLTSETSKQTGIVANVDLAASILDYFSLPAPDHLIGQVIDVDNHSEVNLSSWKEHLDYLFTIYIERRQIITIYVSLTIFLLLLSTVYWLIHKHSKAVSMIQILIGTILLSPLFFMWLTPLIQWVHAWFWILCLLLGALLLTLGLKRIVDPFLFLAIVGLLNTITILFDLSQGSEWMKRSFLGYDPIIGARYYGLGNEYAGILLGSSLLAVTGVSIWLDRTKKQVDDRSKKIFAMVVALFYLFILYFVAAPQLGTNAGASIASLGTYILSLLLLLRVKLTWKHVSIGAGLLVGGFMVFVMLHMGQEQTHIGSALQMLFAGDIGPVLDIALRKWQMNVKLIRVSLWGKLFVSCLVVLFIFLFWLSKNRQDMIQQDPWFHGFLTIVVGSILILFVNDSGIVAAATTMLYVTFPYLYLRFGESKG